jgi:hypothetical protein
MLSCKLRPCGSSAQTYYWASVDRTNIVLTLGVIVKVVTPGVHTPLTRRSMELIFAGEELRHSMESARASTARWGRTCGAKVHQRMAELAACETLAVVASLPALRLRQILGEKPARFAVSVPPLHELVFEVASDSMPAARDGSPDYSRITIIRITEVAGSDGR